MINVYDFDQTIYQGDCARDFFKYCLFHYPLKVSKVFPLMSVSFLRYKLNKIERYKLLESIYQYLLYLDVDNFELLVNEFWDKHQHKVYNWYFKQKKVDDLIISASPSFLIGNICQRLNLNYIAASLDINSGKYVGDGSCYGKDKVRLFKKYYPEVEINEFYSDSYSDQPLALLAKKAFMVKNGCVREWEFIEI